jgi:nucleoside-diphosphate-sugar epimerase
MVDDISTVLVTGGAGYIGSVLVPKLASGGYDVTVYDSLIFGREPVADLVDNGQIRLVRGDIRDDGEVRRLLGSGAYDAVIHLAAISNDPSSEIDPELTRAVNLNAVRSVMNAAKESGVHRFLYASSASVYGIKETPEVTEDLALDPITLYARYKAEGEGILNQLVDDSFCGTSVRAATVCGNSPRLRLDLTINILTEQAVERGTIRVFGGSQQRPNVHIQDLADFYVHLLTVDAPLIGGRAFNFSTRNATVMELAEMVRGIVDPKLPIEVVATDDLRSYHLSAERVGRELGFTPRRPLEDAVREVEEALRTSIADSSLPIYRNVEWMKRRGEISQGEARC